MPELIEQQETADAPVVAEEYKPGELAPSIVTQSQIWKPEDLKKAGVDGVIQELFKEVSNADEAARRFQVLQTWEMRHMDRGYQYLEDNGDGGWKIAGANANKNRNSLAAQDDAGLYPTNILSAQGDIATGALCRGKIKVNFAPKKSKDPASVRAAKTANEYKYLWDKYNPQLQNGLMDLGWTDARALVWTRTIADRRLGMTADGPKSVEITTPYGILESKLPMMVDALEDCSYAQIFEEMDYAVARATYPWMGEKIKPSWGTAGELEFERIARINTRIGIIGKYITGTSGIREATIGYTWFRPGMFFDDNIAQPKRQFLLSNFPDGVFVIMAGAELVCCWNESMDDHLAMGLFTRGFGQNRRSLGSSDLPIQKRVNIWADLWDKFVRSAIPMTLLESKAFNAEAIANLEATPSRFVEVALDEGQAMQDVVGQTPAPVPIPGMQDVFQWYVGPLIQSIDGCTPALFGGGEGEDNTVGATQIRLNQSLERFGPPWIMGNRLFARAAQQAAKCCGLNSAEELSDYVDGKGQVTVNPADLNGDFECSPETVGMIPESGAQREAKVLSLLDAANTNPAVASLTTTASNAREIVKALHIDDVITVPEANWEDGALEDIEILLESEPLQNPDWATLNDQVQAMTALHEAAKQTASQGLQQGAIPDPQLIQQGQQMEQKLLALQQQLTQTAKYFPSVPVSDKADQDHATIAETVLDWMGEPDGRELRRAAQKEPEGVGPNWKKWTNIQLYWQGHSEMAAKFAALNAQPIPPKINISIDPSKLQGQAQTEVLQKAGIQVSQPTGMPSEVETEERIYTPVAEKVIKTKRRL